MLRSLVGSEMCIRDSINAEYGTRRSSMVLVQECTEDSPLPSAESAGMAAAMAADHVCSRVGPNLHAKLLEVPATARRMKDPGFAAMVNQIQANPALLDAYVRMGDPRAVQIMAAVSGVAVEVTADDLVEAEMQGKTVMDDGVRGIASVVEAKRMGTVWFCEGDYEKAISAFRRGLELGPAHEGEGADLHGYVGLCEIKQQNWRYASQACTATLALDRHQPHIWIRRARSLCMLGKWDEALVDLEQAGVELEGLDDDNCRDLINKMMELKKMIQTGRETQHQAAALSQTGIVKLHCHDNQQERHSHDSQQVARKCSSGYQGGGEVDWSAWCKTQLSAMLLDHKLCAVWVIGHTAENGLVKPCEVEYSEDDYAMVKHGGDRSSLFFEFELLVHFKGVIGSSQPVYGSVRIGNISHGSQAMNDWTHAVQQERSEQCTTRRDYVQSIMQEHATELVTKVKAVISKFIETQLKSKLG
eukprot:TRINITY_DN43656_c0_g1_i2.p1 TRINITY_DN43656_c0_g1~~TRINITY_DN43656_c0_g1_i2.p1  ORF type:complete len:473 (+),score=108.21 TRINITY_DN43656_c0_g1_i2:134-1552(+)